MKQMRMVVLFLVTDALNARARAGRSLAFACAIRVAVCLFVKRGTSGCRCRGFRATPGARGVRATEQVECQVRLGTLAGSSCTHVTVAFGQLGQAWPPGLAGSGWWRLRRITAAVTAVRSWRGRSTATRAQ